MDGRLPEAELLEPVPRDWGDWRLGDLADALQRASRALGPSSPAERVYVYPPAGDGVDLPWVEIVVGDRGAVDQLRQALSEGDYLPHFLEDPWGAWLVAEVNEVAVSVGTGEAE